MEANSGSLRLVLFPWLAFGHMHPFLELAKLLAMRGHCITFISTPRNLERLPCIPSHLSSLITFVPLALPHVEPLLETAESASDIPPEHVQYLLKAFDRLAAPFSAFLQSACAQKSTTPDWIIIDIFNHWLPKIAKVFCVPCAFFCIIPDFTVAFHGPPSEYIHPSRTTLEDFTVPPSWIPFPSNLAYRPHEAWWPLNARKQNESGISITRRLYSVITESELICFRTCLELDSRWLSLLAEFHKKDVVPVGLLPPLAEDICSAKATRTNKLELDVIDWLDKHPPKSVLYIALGSEAALSTEQLHELAFGLEKSAVPFLWTLRKPAGMSGAVADMLPTDFQDRIEGVGHVALGWAPQMRILAHASVGGFLTHCGPSSVTESMQFGHPLILLPLIFNQGLIARVLQERGVGVEVPREAVTGNFDREGVARTVCRIMIEEEGMLIRRNAEQIQPIYTDKISQERHLDGFIKRLQKQTDQ
jgi:UDP-glucoronosyl and UDP-glucosyl transferase